ncbi:hypothetical protein P692DRAFT_20836341 [Suillus brevipes Sb2]|nr:hypothetical protein P692DRAFT_20836341 [Suillus brevipes Sb2]
MTRETFLTLASALSVPLALAAFLSAAFFLAPVSWMIQLFPPSSATTGSYCRLRLCDNASLLKPFDNAFNLHMPLHLA